AFNHDEIAKAAEVFIEAVQPECELVSKRLVEIGGDALVVERAALQCEFAKRKEAGFLGDSVDHSPAAAASKHHRVWPAPDFDSLDIIKIAVVLDVVAHSIQEEIG